MKKHFTLSKLVDVLMVMAFIAACAIHMAHQGGWVGYYGLSGLIIGAYIVAKRTTPWMVDTEEEPMKNA